MFHATDDLRIESLRPLIPPAILIDELPLSEVASATVARGRDAARDILQGADDRMLVVVGPCSIHDTELALEYAQKLKAAAEKLNDDLHIIMRVYFEKPRTTVGWKGLINDPDLNGSFNINKGLRTARKLLLDLAEMGMPAGSEYLDAISPQFIADLISWGAIGARTTESQIHRELASGLSMPVGFKNGTGGSVQIALDAIGAAKNPHHFLSVTKQGISAIVATRGNPSCHVILRGSSKGPNYDAESVNAVGERLQKAGYLHRIMIDCSHGNSGKDHTKQPAVAAAVGDQVASGSDFVGGVMIESHLVGGNQKAVEGQALVRGQSITDACVSWDDTLPMLEGLAESVRQRRARTAP